MDPDEDSSVTAAVINVVCELGWRRPRDFLPLAPRFFELLVEGGNNWMAIKIIKLFATLIPLEPRLVRKLLRPLINIIQTTTAMSLLYECINGIIQGGILDEAEGFPEGDEVASLCVSKLRGMVVMDSDPNLKYVALLAFNRIVQSHPMLVAMQQGVILDCLDDPDISIRLQALELAVQMVTNDNLQEVVERLLKQLKTGQTSVTQVEAIPDTPNGKESSAEHHGVTFGSDNFTLPFPKEYRNAVIHKILDICSRDNYSNIYDFDWYVNVLTQLSRLLPPRDASSDLFNSDQSSMDVASRIGAEIRNVAVRVKAVRGEATRAAESLITSLDQGTRQFHMASYVGVIGPAAWVVGEYAEYLSSPELTLNSLIAEKNTTLPPTTLSLYLQAIPKVFLRLVAGRYEYGWDSARHSECSLLLGRVIAFLESLASHPDLDIQERTIEFLELFRLTKEAMGSGAAEVHELPYLLTSVIPNLFKGLDLNPVAIDAQKKVPLPDGLDLDQPINDDLHIILGRSDNSWMEDGIYRGAQDFYHIQHEPTIVSPFETNLKPGAFDRFSYEDDTIKSSDESERLARLRSERRDRNRDDPFYIGQDEEPSRKTTFHQVFASTNGEDLDIDSIPIINLSIESGHDSSPLPVDVARPGKKSRRREKVEVAADETLEWDGPTSHESPAQRPADTTKRKRNLLQVDSSGLDLLSLEDDQPGTVPQPSVKLDEDAEMRKAMQEVERFRLEMQRASERMSAEGIPSEGTLVKKKGKKKSTKSTTTVKKKKKKQVSTTQDEANAPTSADQQ